jgi:hypothetical protein
MSKKYEITIKYLDGQVETTTIITDDIKWSLDQFVRNRKLFNELNVFAIVPVINPLKENDKE